MGERSDGLQMMQLDWEEFKPVDGKLVRKEARQGFLDGQPSQTRLNVHLPRAGNAKELLVSRTFNLGTGSAGQQRAAFYKPNKAVRVQQYAWHAYVYSAKSSRGSSKSSAIWILPFALPKAGFGLGLDASADVTSNIVPAGASIGVSGTKTCPSKRARTCTGSKPIPIFYAEPSVLAPSTLHKEVSPREIWRGTFWASGIWRRRRSPSS